MNKQEYLLTCLIEECSEVIKACTKSLRFGLEDKGPNHYRKNKSHIEAEIIDVQAVHAMLKAAKTLSVTPQVGLRIQDKINKVKKYMEYSKRTGCLDEDIEIGVELKDHDNYNKANVLELVRHINSHLPRNVKIVGNDI